MSNQPPLGIMPRWIHQNQRLYELAAAICRYTQNEEIPMIIPIEWVTEYNELSEIMQKRRLHGQEAAHA